MTDGLVPRELRDAIADAIMRGMVDDDHLVADTADAVVAVIEAHIVSVPVFTQIGNPAFRFLSEPIPSEPAP